MAESSPAEPESTSVASSAGPSAAELSAEAVEPEPQAAAPDDEGETARAGRSAASAQGQRVYVGNLSWSTSWQDLKVRVSISSHALFVLRLQRRSETSFSSLSA